MTMKRDRRRRSQTKRRFQQVESREEDGLDTVDDLAHAAQFAIFPVAAAANVTLAESSKPIKEDDDNEIEVDDDDESKSDTSNADIVANDGNDPKSDDDDDDDDSESEDGESDNDLAEALRNMEQATTEEEVNPTVTASNPPKTENELDGYKASIQELESQLQIKLTVQGGTNKTRTNRNMNISGNDVSPAGTLKNHMVLDRTVVVESILGPPSSHQGSLGPLDEGSLLVIEKPDTNGCNNATKTIWIPLGRIFEVFGPVSKPLYTIRLPSPSFNEKKQPSANKSSLKNKSDAKDYERNGVECKDDEDNTCTQTETSSTNNGESKTKNSPDIKSSIIGRDMISSTEGVHDAEEKDDTIQLPSDTSRCQIIVKETGDVSENNGLPSTSTILSTSSSDIIEKSVTIESEIKIANPTNDEPEKFISDPWAIDGEYTMFLSQNKGIQVYYIQDEAKLIDTGLILKTSGKGCDASNRYDEEILDSSEVYYSDDEKEREAKNKKKGGARKKTQLKNNHQRRQLDHKPQQRYTHQQKMQYNPSSRHSSVMAKGQHGRPTLPPPPPPQYYGYGQHPGSLPQGFHHMEGHTNIHGGFQQPSTFNQYPVGSSFYRHASMPPLPPPRPNQSHSYQGNCPPPYPLHGAGPIPPPPPPPKNPNEPPTYQY